MNRKVRRMKEMIRRYVKRHPFPKYGYIKKMMIEKEGDEVFFPEVYYEVIKTIYDHLEDDNRVLRLSGLMHEHGGIEKLRMILWILNRLLDNAKNYNVATYGRRIEFLYQELDSEWQA